MKIELSEAVNYYETCRPEFGYRQKMLLTISIPDILSERRASLLIREIENIFIRDGISFEIKDRSAAEDDPWDNLDIDEIAADTGIEDFAENHDHYLYGISKRS